MAECIEIEAAVRFGLGCCTPLAHARVSSARCEAEVDATRVAFAEGGAVVHIVDGRATQLTVDAGVCWATEDSSHRSQRAFVACALQDVAHGAHRVAVRVGPRWSAMTAGKAAKDWRALYFCYAFQ